MFDWLAHKYFIWKKPSSMYLQNIYYVGFKNGISAMFIKYNSFIYSIKYACKSTYHYQISYTWWINRHISNIMSLFTTYYTYISYLIMSYGGKGKSILRIQRANLVYQNITLFLWCFKCKLHNEGCRWKIACFFRLTFRHNSKVGSDRIHGAVKGAQIVNK